MPEAGVEFAKVIYALASGRLLLQDISLELAAGTTTALLGRSGSGKTTLLRLLTGELEPTAGTIKKAASLKIVYFSQMRELEEGVTLRRALAPDSDSVVYQGRVVHVASYAAKFLFSGDQLNQPVSRLSGGERARVLIAKLMLFAGLLLIAAYNKWGVTPHLGERSNAPRSCETARSRASTNPNPKSLAARAR